MLKKMSVSLEQVHQQAGENNHTLWVNLFYIYLLHHLNTFGVLTKPELCHKKTLCTAYALFTVAMYKNESLCILAF